MIFLSESELEKSYLHRIIQLLQYSFHSLKIDPPVSTVENMAVSIYNIMEARWRKYHSVLHVLEVCNSPSPIQILAGLFHDVVYLQIDRRVHPKLSNTIGDFLDYTEQYEVSVHDPRQHENDNSLQLVNEIFGFESGKKLTPFTGANEYLSAIVAARSLASLLSVWDLIRVISCIELTIPFRKKNTQNLSPPDQLRERVKKVLNKSNLEKSTQELDILIKDAIEIANRDVLSFSFEDFHAFTNCIWQLILEGNPVFKNPMFTISQFRLGLFKVEKFYGTLDPETIYHHCENSTFDRNYVKKMTQKAKINIQLGREYFQAKLIVAAFLEAVALLTGGDCPLVLFKGQMSQLGVSRHTIMEDFLDRSIPDRIDAKVNSQIIHALDDMLFDAINLGTKKEFTMSSYIYSRIEQQSRLKLYETAVEFFDRKKTPIEYLKSINQELRESLINAVAQMVSTRSSQILELKKVINDS